MEHHSTHKAIVGIVTNMDAIACGGKPYQKIRLAVSCDGEEPDEIVTLLTDFNSNYRTHDVVTVSRWRKGNITSYKLVKE